MPSIDQLREALASIHLTRGLALDQVEAHLHVGLGLHENGHLVLAFYLADMAERRLHQAPPGSTRRLDGGVRSPPGTSSIARSPASATTRTGSCPRSGATWTSSGPVPGPCLSGGWPACWERAGPA